MSRISKTPAMLALLIVITATVIVIASKISNQTPSSGADNPAINTGQSGSTNTDDAAPGQANISYTGSSFAPATVRVKVGGTITVKNDSNRSLDFYSNPNPSHTGNPELNIGEVKHFESKTFTVTRPGTWGYHNHVNPGKTGVIIAR